jgi:hypothetical protein
MGYVTIPGVGYITEPDSPVLTGGRNFFGIESYPGTKIYLEAYITVTTYPNNVAGSLLRIDYPNGTHTVFVGTNDKEEATQGSKYLLTETYADNAENLRQAFLRVKYLRDNFDIIVPPSPGVTYNRNVIRIQSKGAGVDYNIGISFPVFPGITSNYELEWEEQESVNNDSISDEEETVEVVVDVYADPPLIFLGENDSVKARTSMGDLIVTLQKTYAGVPLWFDVGAIFAQSNRYNLPPNDTGWFYTGTWRSFRFTAKRKNQNNFYFSNVIFTVNGSPAPYESAALNDYVVAVTPYGVSPAVKLLSNKPRTPYVRGQKELINFILSDRDYNSDRSRPYYVSTIAWAYDAEDNKLGHLRLERAGGTSRPKFDVVNSCLFDLEEVFEYYPDTRTIRVLLVVEPLGIEVTPPLEYTVMPGCMHRVCQFFFLNRLGGWDAVNFDAEIQQEIKPFVETYNRTVTPEHPEGDGIETVYNARAVTTFIVEGAPVTDAVAEWLKEFAASQVALDGERRRIIIDDFTLRISEENKNMQVPFFKYHISE